MKIYEISKANFSLIKGKARGDRATLNITDVKNTPRKNDLCYLRYNDYLYLVSVARKTRAGQNQFVQVDVLEISLLNPLF